MKDAGIGWRGRRVSCMINLSIRSVTLKWQQYAQHEKVNFAETSPMKFKNIITDSNWSAGDEKTDEIIKIKLLNLHLFRVLVSECVCLRITLPGKKYMKKKSSTAFKKYGCNGPEKK